MTGDVFVGPIGYALGAARSTVEEADARGLLVSGAAALRDAGFRAHHVCAPGESSYDLARAAVEPLRGELGDVGAIVYSTCIPRNGAIDGEEAFRASRDVKHLMDFPASHLQSDFGLDRALIVGLSQQACTGLLGSMRLARSLVLSEPGIERVLCLTSDRFPEGALYEQSYNLISDGAAACIVSRA